MVRKNSIRLPSDRDVGTYLFGLRVWFAKTPAPREINNIATAISPPLDQRCHIVTLVFRERLLEQTEFSIATGPQFFQKECYTMRVDRTVYGSHGRAPWERPGAFVEILN